MNSSLKINEILIAAALLILALTLFPEISLATKKVMLKFDGISDEILIEAKTSLELRLESINTNSLEELKKFGTEASEELKKILKTYGYFDPTIIYELRSPRAGYWIVKFKVNLKKPIVIKQLDLQLLDHSDSYQNLNNKIKELTLKIKVGKVFKLDDYLDTKQLLLSLADRYGYADAKLVEKQVLITPSTNSANIKLVLDPKERSYFGKTSFRNNYFSDKYLARYLPYQEGDYFSNARIKLLQKTLNDSYLFKDVAVQENNLEQNDYHKVTVNLTPRKARHYNLAAGFSTDTGIRALAEAKVRYLNPNAHSLQGVAYASETKKNLELHYLIPGPYPPTDTYDFSIITEDLNNENGEALGGQLAFSYATIVRRWQQNARLSFQHEHYRLKHQAYQKSDLLIPEINWLYDHKDHPINPRSGFLLNIQMLGSVKPIASSTSFFQSRINSKGLVPILKTTSLILNCIVGFTTISDINELPLSLQFYTGGSQSIRGFKYESIGPGKNLMVGSATIKQLIYNNFYLTTFFDAGNASDKFMTKFERGAGVGLIWDTSVGSLEISYAKALSKNGRPGMIQLSIGPAI